jgi:hypothetical protein
MPTLTAIAICLALSGCGGKGGAEVAATRSSATATTASTTAEAASDNAIFPALTDDRRQQLAAYGLVRAAPEQLRDACDKVAKQTDWHVVCPSRVPAGRLAVSAAGGVSGTSTDFSKGYDFSVNSSALREEDAPDPGHWTFAAGTASAMHEQLTAYGHSEPVSRRRLRVGDVKVTRYREPDFGKFPGVYGGHVVYEWHQGDAVMQVSVHGTTHERVLRGVVLLLSQGPDPSPTG